MIRKICASAAAMTLFGFSAAADTLTWKADGAEGWVDNSSWQNKDNFVEGAAPKSGDTVVIPENKTVTVSDDSAEFVSSLARIQPSAESSVIVFTLTAESTTNACCLGYPVASSDSSQYAYGRFVKRGTGELVLTGGSSANANNTSFIVEEGTLRLPSSSLNFCDLSVSNNATLYLPSGGTIGCRNCFVRGNLENTVSKQFRPHNKKVWSVIYETAHIGANVQFYPNGYVRVLTLDNCSTGRTCPYQGGWMEVMSFGKRSYASSVGKCSEFGSAEGNANGCATFTYLGTGEDVDHNPWLGYPAEGALTLDAGATGGLNFKPNCSWGGSTTSSSPTGSISCYILTGSNTTVCTAGGNMNGTTPIRNVVKRGTGTWKFPYAPFKSGTDGSYVPGGTSYTRKGMGTVSVEEGTLQFDNLLDAGVECSLGSGTNRYERGWTGNPTKALEHVCDYSFAFGSDSAIPAVFESVGGYGVFCHGRRSAIFGDITLRNSATNAAGAPLPFRMDDFRAATAKPCTITLDGTGPDDEIVDVSDAGKGPLSIVKTGTGRWTVAGTNVISGTVRSAAGKLTVKAPDAPYTWFRWSVTETWSKAACIAELGIYDADGNRLNTGMASIEYPFAERRDSPAELEPETYCFWDAGRLQESGGAPTSPSYKILSLFDDNVRRLDITNKDGSKADPDTPSTWMRIAFRLPEGSKPAAAYDMVAGIVGETERLPKAWMLEGSNDGYTWTKLHEHSLTNEEMDLYAKTSWLWMADPASGKAFSSGKAATHTGGWPIAGAPTNACETTLGAVGASNGATLEGAGSVTANGLAVDASAVGGTVTNIAFAASGTLTVTNFPASAKQVVLPGVYSGESAANIADWTLTVDGVRKNYLVSVEDGEITITKPGLTILVR